MEDLNQRFSFFANRYPKLGSLKLTIQQFYRPNGESTQARGVVADIALPSVTTHMDVGESDLDNALKFDRVPAANYTPVRDVTATLVSRLRELSQARRDKAPKFQQELKRIERYKKFKSRKAVSLNEKKFLAERAELEVGMKNPFLDDDKKKKKGEVVKRDFYFEEVLSVTLDYTRAMRALRSRN